MKALIASLWQRRWCRSFLLGAIVVGLFLLLPFPRQMVFGPKIDDIPWCVWEREARYAADPERFRRTWLRKAGAWLGFDSGHFFHPSIWTNDSVLPIHIALADDRDTEVRRFALTHLNAALRRGQMDALPVMQLMQRHLDDDDPTCRFLAANHVWLRSEDPAAKRSMLSLVDCVDHRIREDVATALARMASKDQELFEPVARLAKDENSRVRHQALRGMPVFGKRAVPTIRGALSDPLSDYAAVVAAGELGADAGELIPVLQALKRDCPVWMRHDIAEALSKIDAKRFPSPGIGPPKGTP